MKKIIFLFTILLILSCNSQKTKDNIEVTQDGEVYKVEIKNNSGKVIHQLDYPVSPIITHLNEDISSIKISLGNPNSYPTFYNKKTKVLSTPFYNVFATNLDKELIVYSEENKVALKSIFKKDKVYFIERDYSPTAVIFTAIEEIKFIGNEKLKLSYMTGSDYSHKEEIISIKDLTNKKNKASSKPIKNN